MSWLSVITGAEGRKQAGRDINRGASQATKYVQGAYPKAQTYMSDAYNKASGRIGTGYDEARGYLDTGYDDAVRNTNLGYTTGIETVQKGYGTAQGYYDTPEMVAARAELSNRAAGKGGFTPEVTEQMKAGAREEFGSGLRGIEQTLGSYYGDSGASGLAGENLARAGTQLAGKRAGAIRDIDIGNAQLARQEQGAAIESMRAEALQRAGLSAEGAQFISSLQAEQGKTIGEIMQNRGINQANLSREESQFLANLDSKYGADIANLTTEEATILANIATGKASAQAAMRDTQGLMPLLSGAVQGATQGATMAAMASSREFKQDITPLTDKDHEDNLQVVTDMNMVTYRYKPEFRPSDDNGKVHTGLIAEDTTDKIRTTEHDKLHVGDMIGVALSAIKALTQRIELMEGKEV